MDVLDKLNKLDPDVIPPRPELNLPGRKKRTPWLMAASVFVLCCGLALTGLRSQREYNFDEPQYRIVDNSYISPNELWNQKTILVTEKRK